MIELETLYLLSPSAYYILRSLNIVKMNGNFTAKVGGSYLYLGKEFWRMPLEKRVFILLHEALHKVFRHDVRANYYSGSHIAFNMGADAKVNHYIFKEFPKARRFLTDWSRYVPENIIERLSAEELARRCFENRNIKRRFTISQPRKDPENDVISVPFDDNVFKMALGFGSFITRKDIILEALRERFSIDWYGLLSNVVPDDFDIDYSRINERYGVFGKTKETVSQKVALIDISMSISDMELSMFLDALRTYNFDRIIWFDDGIIAETSEIPQRISGRGRTRITPALMSLEGGSGVLVIFSDGYWDDCTEAVSLLNNVLGSFHKVLITVDREVDGFDEVFHINVYDL